MHGGGLTTRLLAVISLGYELRTRDCGKSLRAQFDPQRVTLRVPDSCPVATARVLPGGQVEVRCSAGDSRAVVGGGGGGDAL